MTKRVLTIKEAAQALGVSEKTALKYARERRIVIVNPTDYHSYKVLAASIDAYLEERSEWHARQRESDIREENVAPERLDTKRRVRSRGRRNGDTPMEPLNIEDFRSGYRLKNG